MVFVVLGTQKFQCNRLLKMVDALVETGIIKEEVIAQKGHSDYIPKNYATVDFMEKEEFESRIEECSLLITHSGVGTILAGIYRHKPIIVFPRLKKYKEHVDDHQLEIAQAFQKKGLVLLCGEEDDMAELIALSKVKRFGTYVSHRDYVNGVIRNYIEKLCENGKEKSEMDKSVSNREKPQIELYVNNSQVMNDAIDRIVVEIHNKKMEHNGAKKVLLTGCGPQCGSTSTCIGLGIAFSAAKWKTLIIDCDLRKQRTYKKLNENTDLGLSDFLLSGKENEDYEEIIYNTNFDNLSYIPCGKFAASPARLFCSNMMKKLLEYADEKFDYVIFDFPSISVAPDAQILFGKVDGIVLVAALDGVTKMQIRKAKQKIRPFADKYYGMIINKIDLNLYKKYVKKYDYYFVNRDGSQKLGVNANKKHMKNKKTNKGGANNEQNK